MFVMRRPAELPVSAWADTYLWWHKHRVWPIRSSSTAWSVDSISLTERRGHPAREEEMAAALLELAAQQWPWLSGQFRVVVFPTPRVS